MKKRYLIGIGLGVILFALLNRPVNAVRVSFGVSPSTVGEFFLEQKDAETLIFTVTNDSVTPQGLEDFGAFAFDILTNAFFDDETLDASEWVQFDLDYMHLKPEEYQEITVELTIPEDAYDGFYVLWLEFMRVDDQEAMIRQYSVLRVPLLLYIGPDWVNGTNVVVDFDLMDIDLIVNGELLSQQEQASTVWQEVFYFFGQMFRRNPFHVARDISNRPVYKIYENGQIYLDLNRDIIVPMSDVVTSRSSSVNDWQYIYVPSEARFQEVASAIIEYRNEDDVSIPEEGVFAEQVLRIHLADDQVVEIQAHLGILNMMMDQLRALLANFEGVIHLDDLINELHVPINRHYTIPDIHVQTVIENSGTIAIRPLGNTYISTGLGNILAELAFSPANIFNDDTRELWVTVPEELNLATGTYTLETRVFVHDLEESIQGRIHINNNFRDDILMRTMILFGSSMASGLVVIFIGYRIIRKKIRARKKAMVTGAC